jgi:hypothetical protein
VLQRHRTQDANSGGGHAEAFGPDLLTPAKRPCPRDCPWDSSARDMFRGGP